MIKAKGIYKNYDSKVILSDASFSIERGQRIALVGRNGVGKTTILKILAGIAEFDSGSIKIDKNINIGYLPQNADIIGDKTCEEYIKENNNFIDRSFDSRLKIMFSGFDLDDIDQKSQIKNLSSGQRSKIFLINILLKNVDLLLLDEPTNNLDLPALIWLEDFLMKKDITCVIVSHDRFFLDKITRKVFELDWESHTLNISSGKYNDYLQALDRERNRIKKQYYLQKEEIDRLEESVNLKKEDALKGAKWQGTDKDKMLVGFKRERAGKSFKTAKAIEKRISQIEKIEKPIEYKLLSLSIIPKKSSGVLDIELTKAMCGYLNGFNMGPITLSIGYGDRVGIVGVNGSGKSTLLKIINGQLEKTKGDIHIGSGIIIGNMMQEHETLSKDKTIFNFIQEKTNIREQDIYSNLVKFNFNEKQVNNSIENLSPGEKARLILCLFSILSVNTLILDEPTNHLDLEAIQALEEALNEYTGTIILVSHDRYFIEKMRLERIYILSEGKIKKINNYQEYIDSLEAKVKKLLKLL